MKRQTTTTTSKLPQEKFSPTTNKGGHRRVSLPPPPPTSCSHPASRAKGLLAALVASPILLRRPPGQVAPGNTPQHWTICPGLYFHHSLALPISFLPSIHWGDGLCSICAVLCDPSLSGPQCFCSWQSERRSSTELQQKVITSPLFWPRIQSNLTQALSINTSMYWKSRTR